MEMQVTGAAGIAETEAQSGNLFERAKALAATGLAIGALALAAATPAWAGGKADRQPVAGNRDATAQPFGETDPQPAAGISETLAQPGGGFYNSGSESYYYWAGGRQYTEASGASVLLSQEKPGVNVLGSHALAELYVESADHQNIVGVGWKTKVSLPEPTLFVESFVNKKWSGDCMDGCKAFTPLPGAMQVGDEVQKGALGKYEIKYEYPNSRWLVSYNDQPIGFFPASLWSTNFMDAGEVQVYGEVQSPSPDAPDIQMGNGTFGSQPGSASISGFTLFPTLDQQNCAPAPALTPYANVPSLYDYGAATPDSLTYGGPGAYTGPDAPVQVVYETADKQRPGLGQEADASASAEPQDAAVSVEASSCLPDAAADIQSVARHITTRLVKHPELGGFNQHGIPKARLKIPVKGPGMVYITEESSARRANGRPDPNAVNDLHVVYKQFKKSTMGSKIITSAIKVAELDFQHTPPNQWTTDKWTANYMGNGPLSGLATEGTTNWDAFDKMLYGLKRSAGFKPGQPRPRL